MHACINSRFAFSSYLRRPSRFDLTTRRPCSPPSCSLMYTCPCSITWTRSLYESAARLKGVVHRPYPQSSFEDCTVTSYLAVYIREDSPTATGRQCPVLRPAHLLPFRPNSDYRRDRHETHSLHPLLHERRENGCCDSVRDLAAQRRRPPPD